MEYWIAGYLDHRFILLFYIARFFVRFFEMMLTESKLFVGALKVAGPAFFLGMQASSVRTAISIAENRSTMALSPLPFISLLTNCIIWSCYGFLRQEYVS